MDKAKKTKPIIEKVGVAWKRDFKKSKGIKVSINKEIFILYENKKKGNNELAPDFVVVRFLDEKK
jgi:hypothetical protein